MFRRVFLPAGAPAEVYACAFLSVSLLPFGGFFGKKFVSLHTNIKTFNSKKL